MTPGPAVESEPEVVDYDYLDDAVQRPRVPGWLSQLGVKEGEYFSGSKLSLRRLMTPAFELKPRVWGCLYLHTNGFRSEIAYKRFKNQNVYLRPADIATELYKAALKYYADAGVELTDKQKEKLRVSKTSVRRILAALEDEGSCERQTSSGEAVRTLSPDRARRLSGDDFRIVLFAVPRRPLTPPLPPDKVAGSDYLTPKEVADFGRLIKSGFSDFRILGILLKRVAEVVGSDYLRALKVDTQDYLPAEIREACEDYLEAEKVAAERLEKRLKVGATGAPLERTSERTVLERNGHPAAASSSVAKDKHSPTTTTTTTKAPAATQRKKAPTPQSAPTPEEITFLQGKTAIKDRSALRTLILKCREVRPNIKVSEIWELWTEKFPQLAPKQRDPATTNFIGLMITSIVEMLSA